MSRPRGDCLRDVERTGVKVDVVAEVTTCSQCGSCGTTTAEDHGALEAERRSVHREWPANAEDVGVGALPACPESQRIYRPNLVGEFVCDRQRQGLELERHRDAEAYGAE